MSSFTQRLQRLLKKVGDIDKDERYMALSDICNELENLDGQLEVAMQAAISKAILNGLDDTSTDVQTVTVKTLAALIRKLAPEQILDIGDKLTALIMNPAKHESRDIYSIGLKTIVASLGDSAVSSPASEQLGTKVLTGIIQGLKAAETLRGSGKFAQDELNELESSALDVAKEVLSRFGSQLSAVHDSLLEVLKSRLENAVEAVRKRVIACFGALVANLNEKSFHQFMEYLIHKIEHTNASVSSSGSAALFSLLQTIGVISQSAGPRMGKYIPRILPQLQRFCSTDGAADASLAAREQLLELWENCLQAFESLLFKCHEMTPYAEVVVNIALQFLVFDPNYSYDADESDGSTDVQMEQSTGGGDWGDEDAGADDWGDGDNGADLDENEDDDNSWKVRRAAVRCLAAFIRARPELLEPLNSLICHSLVARFKERDQNVKLAVLKCVADLLKEATGNRGIQFSQRSAAGDYSSSAFSSPANSQSRHVPAAVTAQVKPIVDSALKLLKDKSCKADTKISILQLWGDLILVLSGGVESHLARLIPAALDIIQTAPQDDTKLKLESLHFLRILLECHSSESLAPFLASIASAGCSSVKENSLKLKSEALRLLGLIVQRLPPNSNELAAQLYGAIFSQLSLLDVDQEVKEASLHSISLLLSQYCTMLADRLTDCLTIIVQRLNNELTRVFALRALARIAPTVPSSIVPQISSIVGPAFAEYFMPFLKKENQILRHETVKTLNSLVRLALLVPGSAPFPPSLFSALHRDLLPLLSDSDLHLAHLALELSISLISVHPTIPAEESRALLSRLIIFVRSPLLHGLALQSLVKLFCAFLSVRDNSTLKYSNLVAELLAAVDAPEPSTNPTLNRSSSSYSSSASASPPPASSQSSSSASHSFISLAQCISALAQSSGSDEVSAIIKRFIDLLRDSNGSVTVQQVALLVLGELGRHLDLTPFGPVEEIIFRCFAHPQEAIRSAAALSLGNLAVGNRAFYLPQILGFLGQAAEVQPLTLTSLREAILRHSMDSSLIQQFMPHVASLLPLLLGCCSSSDELIRSTASECLCILSIIQPESVFPHLVQLAKSENSASRASIITAFRFALGPHSNSVILKSNLPIFLSLLRDPDLTVHRQCLLALNLLCHSHLDLMAELRTSTILPILYADIQPDPSLVRLVDLGPFKHKVDDGLPIRKAAYLCLETLYATDPQRFDAVEFLQRVKTCGLVDHNDIQILCYDLLYSMADTIGERILDALDDLPNDLMKGVKEQLKEAKGETNPERAKDVLRAAVRAIDRCARIPGVENCPQFVEFYQRVLKTALLLKMLQEMQGTQ